MQIKIAEGPVEVRPLGSSNGSASKVKVTVLLTPQPDVNWIRAFYSEDVAGRFFSARPKSYEINGSRCSCTCVVGRHERALRVLGKLLEATNHVAALVHSE